MPQTASTLSPEEVHRFEARHPIGTKARLALALLLFLGVRRGDFGDARPPARAGRLHSHRSA